MLWDLIRDFFVIHVFGGTTSTIEYYNASWGEFSVLTSENESYDAYLGNEVLFVVSKGNGSVFTTNMSDWLSTTATAISITIIVVLCCLFVYKIIRLIGGLIR